MSEQIKTQNQETTYSEAEILDGRRISRKAVNNLLKEAGIMNPKTASGIIDTVPGVERKDTVVDSGVSAGMVQEDVQFRGDPSRVIGHPSNPNSEAAQAYADHLREASGDSGPK